MCVRETPLKKQVTDYQQFKLQRTRSKLGKTSFPEVSSIEESPYRVAQLQSGSSFPRDIDGSEREVILSTSSDEEDFNGTPDALMSFYLSSPPATSQENNMPTKDQHLLEAPTDSMVAFNLTTPPKEAIQNFVNVTSSLE